jgi:hypothetical protein
MGVPTPRPPVEERGAAPQTPLHKGRFVGSDARFALASQRESICGLEFLSVGWSFFFGGGSVRSQGSLIRNSYPEFTN